MPKSSNPNAKRYYVYEWFIVESQEVFYVGKGCKYRYKTTKRENRYFMHMLSTHNCDVRKIADNLTEQEALDLERERIAYYRALPNSRLTNVQDGGDNPPTFYGEESPSKRPDVRQKMSISAKQRYLEHPDARQNLSYQLQRFYRSDKGRQVASQRSKAVMSDPVIREKIKNSNVAYWASPDARARKSEIMKTAYSSEEVRQHVRGANNGASRRVMQCDVDGNLICEYATLMEADAATGVSYKNISKAVRGHIKTAGGFIWKFADDKQITYAPKCYITPPQRKRQKVAQYTITGELVAVYDSIAEATKKNHYLTHTNIIANIRGRTKTAYGYVWKYHQD